MSNVKKSKINKDFFLLWQGHFVSGIGDIFYTVALGFFVLQLTGSTALMGSVMATSAFVNILVSPVAGVIADRISRRRILVITDFGRGGLLLLMAVLAYFSILDLWMLFVFGVLLGILDAFFSPAVNAFLPDIVKPDKLMKSNALMSYSDTAQHLLGGPLGGILFATMGAPVLFLIDGITFILSAVSERFISTKGKVLGFSGNSKEKVKVVLADFKDGIKYIKHTVGLKSLMIFALFANLFGGMIIMLLLPYFERTEGLGVTKYGIALAMMAVGGILGLLFVTFSPDEKNHRGRDFIICWIVTCVSYGVMMFLNFIGLIFLLLLGTMTSAIFNVLIKTCFQELTPANQRGKVFSIMGIFMNGMLPVSMIMGGVLAEFFDISIIVAVGCTLNLLVLLIAGFTPNFWIYLKGNILEKK